VVANEVVVGGIDGEEMLKDALRMLQTSNFSMADVLIISDFYFGVPRPKTRDKMNKERANGTRFYGGSRYIVVRMPIIVY